MAGLLLVLAVTLSADVVPEVLTEEWTEVSSDSGVETFYDSKKTECKTVTKVECTNPEITTVSADVHVCGETACFSAAA